MALFKCKMCGGDLEVADGVTIAECEYCGTKQTVPKAMDENLQNLFNRANSLRIKSEFDKAEKLYEKIIQADTTQAEAYWGLILCKYGIEYVDDPTTFKKIPTCHRASYESIIADNDYKSALENADISQRAIYEEQAKEIDRIQKDILALAQKEEAYDVFICYKETDADGHRTQDSVIANDIYYQLTQEGFKVFYAAITLEGKLGSAYEPIIFAALNSAKVMLSIGTKSEYFNAVWVKNEWSRFLKIIKKDRSKLLIPCFRDMDAYELPEEFAHLQAQDMAKIGFMQDLIRGIKKVVRSGESKGTTVRGTNANTAPLLKRVFMFLEDGDWKSADEYCEKVLDIDPECAEAYLGKLMAELAVKRKEHLKLCSTTFEHADNYNKILRFGNEALVSEIKQYNAAIRERNEEKRKASIYDVASDLAKQQTPENQIKAAKEFEKILGYRDANERAKNCRNQALLIAYNSALGVMNRAVTSQQFSEAGKRFLEIADDYEPAREKAKECVARSKELTEEKRKAEIYRSAKLLMTSATPQGLLEAIKKFESIKGYKDSDEKIAACRELIPVAEKKQRQKRLVTVLVISAIIMIIIMIIVYNAWIAPSIKYRKAENAIADGRYVDAYDMFTELDGYKDSEQKKQDIYDQCVDEALRNSSPSQYIEIINKFGITEFVIPDGVTSIEYSAFRGCSSLTSITIPDSVTSIEWYAFSDCSSLTSITIPDSVTSIGESAFFGCKGLTSITIPDSVTSIGNSAFYECLSLTSVSIGDGVTYIGDSAFRGCSSLTSITIPDGVASIGNYAFYNCTGLASITIPDSVTGIGDRAFQSCSSLTSITIPDSVTSIGEDAFYYCSGLASITIPFVGATKDGTDNTHFGYIFGASSYIYNDNYVPSSLKTVVITGGTSIGNYAFYNCSNLTSITIPDSVASIGNSAFSGCKGLTNITIPDGVTSIGDYAFRDCSSLEYNTYGNAKYLGNESNPYVVLIEATSTGITSCQIHEDTKVIAEDAFYNCSNLTSITIPDSVASIGSSAFWGCSGITDINYSGTMEQWSSIRKGSYWNSYTESYTVHCTDGDIAK